MTMRPNRRFAASGRAKPRLTVPSRDVDLVITHVGARGDGVARLGDEQVFVPFTVAGDRVSARIDGRRGDGLAAHVVAVTEAGPGRVSPPCPYFGECGGCALQHMDGGVYAQWKGQILSTHLERQGLAVGHFAPLVQVGMGSRRRAALTFSRRGGSVALGFNARSSHRVVDVARCLLLDDGLNAALTGLRAMLLEVVAAGEDGGITVTISDNGLDVLVDAEARLDLFDREKLAAYAQAAGLARLSWRRPGQGMIDPIARLAPAVSRFAGIGVEPVPGGFLQPTREGEAAIAQLVTQAVMGAGGPVADLYSGCGSFTFPLAVQGLAVHAAEGEAGPIAALQAAANAHGLPVTSEVRDLSRRPLLAHELKRFKAVVFDPPRAGAQAQAEQLAAAGPGMVVAVSCNPATLARDLKILVNGGYAIRTVTPIDQFPFSPHLEAVAVCQR